MGVELTGSIYSTTLAVGNSDGAITGIDVPGDAEVAIVLALLGSSSVGIDFDVLNFDAGVTVDFTEIIGIGSSTDAYPYAYRLFGDNADFPSGTGQTLTFSTNYNAAYGNSHIVLIFLKNVDDSDSWANFLIGTDSVNGETTDWVSDSLGTVGANDMAFIVAGDCGPDIESTPTGADQTEIYEYSGADWRAGMAYELNEATPEVECVGSQYFSGIAFAIKGAAAGTLKTVTDVGAGADSIAQILNSLSIADAGSGADLPAISVNVPVTDSGQGADVVGAIAALLSVIDAGSGADLPAISVNLNVADSGSGADAVSVIAEILKTVTDAGTGMDAIGAISVNVPVTDSGQGADVIGAIAALLSVIDAGSCADLPAISVNLNVADSGSGADAVSVIAEILKTVTDAGTGMDAIGSISVNVPVTDSGQGADVVGAINALLSVTDLGSGVDVVVKFEPGPGAQIVTVSITLKKRDAEFTLQKRSADFEFKKRNIEFNLT